jgi:ABC-type Fe3+-hydroxamate transport system substrate-binding protein
LVTATGYGFGAETLVDDCIRRAGGLNVLSEAGLAGETTLAAETVLALDPDVILVSAPLERPRRGAPGLLGDVERWRTVKALRREAVHGVPSAWMGSVSLSALLALEATASLLREGAR